VRTLRTIEISLGRHSKIVFRLPKHWLIFTKNWQKELNQPAGTLITFRDESSWALLRAQAHKVEYETAEAGRLIRRKTYCFDRADCHSPNTHTDHALVLKVLLEGLGFQLIT